MKLFHRRSRPVPEEAVRARAHAITENDRAKDQLNVAQAMAATLAAMRERNHFAESMQIAYRRAQQ